MSNKEAEDNKQLRQKILQDLIADAQRKLAETPIPEIDEEKNALYRLIDDVKNNPKSCETFNNVLAQIEEMKKANIKADDIGYVLFHIRNLHQCQNPANHLVLNK